MSTSSEKRRIARQTFESDVPPLNVRCSANAHQIVPRVTRRSRYPSQAKMHGIGLCLGPISRRNGDLHSKGSSNAFQACAMRALNGSAIQFGSTARAVTSSFNSSGESLHQTASRLSSISLGPSHTKARITAPALL